ncbi:hypothetical protein [Prosthecobacter sp.]|uniref:hypothetical protein n=1 Tax=Prosthecobacter sp. TaxID=1965333 RepID=UPI001D88D03D|nr:hypothetical protein [Prosthecobacter sp.]MCB1276781.1 hypothetical protein [Prosthecobacter sp.]
MAEHASNCRPAPKWAAVIEDRLFPMPRQKFVARDILDQTAFGPDVVLQRDHNSSNDVVIDDGQIINLGDGNVFRVIPRCEAKPSSECVEPAKRAFVLDDEWKVTVIPAQTGRTLKRLFDLPDEVELLRDYESPNDVVIANDEHVHHAEGCVFTARKLVLTIKVNNNPVRFTKRRVTALEIKQTAIAQGVQIGEDFVLHAITPDGNQGPAIPDDKKLVLKPCDEFRCVAADDNS